MIRKFVAVIALITSPCPLVSAGSLQIVDVPTPGLPGHCTYLLSYLREPGEEFRGFEATFSGDIHQVNPFGILSTVFTDNNSTLSALGTSVLQDSQFLFRSGDVFSISTAESDTVLKGAISGLSRLDLPNPTPFAQVVTQYDEASFSLAVDSGQGPDFYGGALMSNLGIPSIRASINITAEPAIGLPGYQTYTLWLSSGGTTEGILVDATITGPIHQGDDPGSTVFRSEASEGQRATDSHFFNDDSRVLGGELALVGSEDLNHLSANLPLAAFSAEDGSPFAQVTTDDPASVNYHLSISYCDIIPNELILTGTLPDASVPEPQAALLVGLAFVATFGCGARCRKPREAAKQCHYNAGSRVS